MRVSRYLSCETAPKPRNDFQQFRGLASFGPNDAGQNDAAHETNSLRGALYFEEQNANIRQGPAIESAGKPG